MPAKALLIDGHSLAYRAFYATSHSRNVMATSKGEWTNAVYVFVSKLLKVWREERPDYIVVAFDVGKTFRHEQYPAYKSQRAKTPEELKHQIERIYQVIEAFGIPTITCEGYEADDVLGTLAKKAAGQGVEAVILTGDTDILQLVDERVRVLIPRGRYGDESLYGPQEVAKRYSGLSPEQLIDLKALVGDPSDNIPGIKGIGIKTATSLLQKYGSIEGIFEHLDEIKSKRVRNALTGRREEALRYKDLVRIRCDVPLDFELEKARVGNFDRKRVAAVFRELEFDSLMNRIPEGMGYEEDESAVPREPEIKLEYTVVDTLEKLDALVAELRQSSSFSFDTETTSTRPMAADLVGVSVATAPGRAWYIPVGHGLSARQAAVAGEGEEGLPLFSGAEGGVAFGEPLISEQGEKQLPLPDVVSRLRPVLEDERIAKYAHNACFDITVLAQTTGVWVRGLNFDTMIAAWVVDPAGRSRKLKALAEQRLGVEMTGIQELIGSGKSQVTMDRVSVARVAPYACADADMTLRLVEPLSKDLCEREQWDLFTEIEMPLVPILARMEMAGVRLDVEYLRQMSAELLAKQREIERQIHELAGHEFNVNSTRQLSKVLFEELRLPRQGIRKTVHGYSTAADVLALLKDKHPIVPLILEHRQIAKLRSTYVETLPTLVNPRTGRLHTSYNQTGTVTGRLSSSNPNLQNIPIRTELGRKIRRAFVAEDGWLFLAADYSQIELRVLAHMSQDPELLAAFHKGEDIHARTAAAVYGIPIEEVTREQRRIAKTVNFGLIYGQSAYGLSQQTDLDYGEAERFIAAYFERYPRVKEWLENTRRLAYAQGFVETLLGRRRYFPELKGTQRAYAGQRAAAERQAINAPIQGTAADILKIAMIRLDERLQAEGRRARMVLQVHDELVLEVPSEELEEVAAATREVMEGAYTLSVPFKVDMEVGENWLDMQLA